MHSVLLVTGPPCSGKTTVARVLAERRPRGVHIVSDEFYAFVCHPVSPYRAGSHEQNAAVIRAAATAAASFARDGWDVVLDGVIGTWFVPHLEGALNQLGVRLDCVALELGLQEALVRRRVRGHGSEQMVVEMHAAFAHRPFPPDHVLNTENRTPEELAFAIEARKSAGKLRMLGAPGARTSASPPSP